MAEMPDIHVAGTGSFALEVVEYARAAGRRVAGLVELLDASRVGTAIHGLPVRAAADLPPGGTAVVGAGGDRARHWEVHGGRGLAARHGRAPVRIDLAERRARAGMRRRPRPRSSAPPPSWASTSWWAAARSSAITRAWRPASCSTRAPTWRATCASARGPTIGMGALVADHIEVGARAVVAAGAVVVRPVAEGVRVQGVPARPFAGEDR